ncbi:hypothetical protein K505DRAFT_366120 [Melanomma pulvis-pyrius CBS 109.77]|uniref:NAD(P)-binding protein n=1 Tax=Melanomma pulvis-pyrius CBS 109.77 TaxID=1314802 RepID=A0A6A6WXN7_9PLEO|nr:hypothetical protein K505DRAFT_366120 [Melanomma pulvis-pyrius CBS 109.77]
MVTISEIHKSNASFAAQGHSGLVEMVGLLHSSIFYVLGRDPSRYKNKLDKLKKIGPTNNIVFVETQQSAFDYVVANDSQNHVTFIHATPGFVHTDTPRTAYPSKADGLAWWALVSVLQAVSGWIIRYFGMAAKESGERHAYKLTSDKFIPGSWRVSHLNEVIPDNDVLVQYRESGWDEKIWEFTNRVWNKALVRGAKP